MTKEMAEEDWKINNDWSVFGKTKEELAKERGIPTSVLDEMEKRPISQDNPTEEKKILEGLLLFDKIFEENKGEGKDLTESL